jgi:small subunit ribosomal protein S17
MAEEQPPENAEETTEAQAPETAGVPEAPASAPAAQSAPDEPQEVLAPKERRQRARQGKAAQAKARATRTPEERHADRIVERRQKAHARREGRAKAKAKASASSTGTSVTPPREHVAGVQKVRQGVVVSDKADKTITVRIDTARRHRRYDKIVRTSQTLHAHDEANDAHTGDTVTVREARPLSRTKRWRLIEVLERAK